MKIKRLTLEGVTCDQNVFVVAFKISTIKSNIAICVSYLN
jgi:hypothetical protein